MTGHQFWALTCPFGRPTNISQFITEFEVLCGHIFRFLVFLNNSGFVTCSHFGPIFVSLSPLARLGPSLALKRQSIFNASSFFSTSQEPQSLTGLLTYHALMPLARHCNNTPLPHQLHPTVPGASTASPHLLVSMLAPLFGARLVCGTVRHR